MKLEMNIVCGGGGGGGGGGGELDIIMYVVLTKESYPLCCISGWYSLGTMLNIYFPSASFCTLHPAQSGEGV